MMGRLCIVSWYLYGSATAFKDVVLRCWTLQEFEVVGKLSVRESLSKQGSHHAMNGPIGRHSACCEEIPAESASEDEAEQEY